VPKKYPPLEHREVIEILLALGFHYDATDGSHEQYEGSIDGKKRKVTVVTNIKTFDDRDIKSFISQAFGCMIITKKDVKRFYGATKNTVKKVQSL
jgi:predicted RNA binding protein YcfA (HicA-like mRNA interferase family)